MRILFFATCFFFGTQTFAQDMSHSQATLREPAPTRNFYIFTSPIGDFVSRYNLGLGFSPVSWFEVGPKATLHRPIKHHEVGLRARVSFMELGAIDQIDRSFLFVRGGVYRKRDESERPIDQLLNHSLAHAFGQESNVHYWETVQDWSRELALGGQVESPQGFFANFTVGLDWYTTRYFAQNGVTGEIREDLPADEKTHLTIETNFGFAF